MDSHLEIRNDAIEGETSLPKESEIVLKRITYQSIKLEEVMRHNV